MFPSNAAAAQTEYTEKFNKRIQEWEPQISFKRKEDISKKRKEGKLSQEIWS